MIFYYISPLLQDYVALGLLTCVSWTNMKMSFAVKSHHKCNLLHLHPYLYSCIYVLRFNATL